MAGVVYRPSLLLLPLLLILGRVHDGMETRRQARDNSKGGGGWRDWLVGWLVVSVGDLYEVGPLRDCRIRWVHDAQEERVTRVWRRSRLRVLCCAKKRDSNQHWFTCGRRVWRVRRKLELVRCPASPRGSHPSACTFAPRRRLGCFLSTVDSSCEAQQARYRMRRAPVGPKGADAILWEALWMGRTDELTLLDSCDGIGELIGWGGF